LKAIKKHALGRVFLQLSALRQRIALTRIAIVAAAE